MDIININYISPIGNYKFDNKLNNYYLVHVGIDKIHKILLPNLDNINQQCRAFAIDRAIKITNHYAYPTQSFLIFEHNIKENIIKLLFVAKFDPVKYDYFGIIELTLRQPSKVLGDYRMSNYVSDKSFIYEQFFNYESFEPQVENKCILFMSKLHKTQKKITEPTIIKLDSSDRLIFNRYHNALIKEILPSPIPLNDLCLSNTQDDYIKLVGHYNIDVNRYNKTNLSTFKELFLRPINPTFRPLVSQYYFNNLINAPADGRVKAFDVKDSPYPLNEIIQVPFALNEGSGMMTRLTPGDYQRVSMPYPGYLTEVLVLPAYTALKFESTYFMPPSVEEREYISVLYGHRVSMSREFPELVDVQPRIKLIFYVILFGKNVVLTNVKLIDTQKVCKTKIPYEKVWFEKGEEIGGFNCCHGNVMFITNRPIDFTNDIRYWSSENMECYIRNKDIFGLLL